MRKSHFRCLLAAHIVVLAFAAAPAAQACDGADALPSQSSPDAYADATVCLVNEERAAAGFAPLAGDQQLAQAARGYAGEMISTGVFAHRSANGESVLDRVRAHGSLARWALLGENLGTGTLSLATPRALVLGWMNSPSHRANVLHERFTHLGIGVAFGAPGDAAKSEAATYASAFGEAQKAEPAKPTTRKKKRRARRLARIRRSSR